ncbi:putative sugar nucleotidyltransferase [Sphaerochaeta pleomorpha str. Grapes]|uniref:Putative sugar nucleotidyltransferase n=1 Tax=Sphaerochaeta pleomorpha (strain ATCC BAA-1885 / DSM 22778 / Grapes) TaxID=158190 RepID=G8QW85_SPHPG|nr:phosphocholine cytidylyltransferase family protein [Sphaerochaeta pleomorpha]AEV29383.1 putative sugar nucleotidyltransferase [Sphaerochaeta pleomorpha str. Grapes]
MRLLILAAGKGSRISKHLPGIPKSLVEIGGSSLLEYTVSTFFKKGIDSIGIALGYQQEMIRENLKAYPVQYFYNPFFDVTNSIASAWFALDFIFVDDDVLIMNGDVFMEEALIDEVIKTKTSPVLFADGSRKEEADYKFLYKNNLLVKYGKDLKDSDVTGEYVGIAKLGKAFIPIFCKKLVEMIYSQQHPLWWENVLYQSLPEIEVFVQETNGLFWAEVDYIEDYERILKFRKCLGYFTLSDSCIGG